MSIARILRDSPEEYHAVKALSKSGMDELLRCPAKFKLMLDNMGNGDHEQTDAMLCGSLFHAMALEPDAVGERYAKRTHPGTTKAGKEESKAATESGLSLVRPEMWADCEGMAAAVSKHPLMVAAHRADDFMSEVSSYWNEGPVPCKARIDAVATLPMFGLCAIDLKSTQDSSPGAIEKSIYQWGYHRQAVWYRRALRAVGMNAQAFALVFVEKTPPYVVTAANVAEAAQAVALDEIKTAVELYKECSVSGVWPGYTSSLVTEIDLPEWAYRRSAA